MALINSKADSPSRNNSPSNRNPTSIAIIGFLCVTQSLTICCLAGSWCRSSRKPESLVVINQDDPFVVQRAKQFDLPQAIQQYDQVTNAIERYHQDYGTYPPDLSALVSEYLSTVPRIYIRNGERLAYSPEPLIEGYPPFTFYIYGHYPGLAFMHGWMLYYCPAEFDGCNASGDRHYHPHRVNYRWIWISRSAL
jgi:hypothetical protein